MTDSITKSSETTIKEPVEALFLQLSIYNVKRGLEALSKAIKKRSIRGELRREDFFRTFSFFCFSKAESKEFLKLFEFLGLIKYTNHKIYISDQIKNWRRLLE